MKLREYQERAVQALRNSYSQGKRAPLLVMPTGSGKTICFAAITRGARAKGTRVCVIVHRRELLKQASLKLSEAGVEHGIIAPGFTSQDYPVCVASVQTLAQRLKRSRPEFDFLIYDEAHHVSATTWRTVHSHYPCARSLGVTATPSRSDGKGLGISSGGIFDDLILGPSMRELIELGFLVRPRVFGPPVELDLSGIKRMAGDFNGKELASRVDKPTITGSAVEHYKRLCPGIPAVAFCVNVQHAEHVASEFRAAGFKASSLHGKLSVDARERVIDDLTHNQIQIMTSVDIVSEGFDLPKIKCAIQLRPTQSTGLYMQQVGRILRPTPDGGEAYVLDHAGNYLLHGLPDEDREWTLDGIVRHKSKDSDSIKVRQCQKCFAVYEWNDQCPDCGHINKTPPRKIREADGELTEVTKEQIEALKRDRVARMRSARTAEDIERVAKENGYKPGWVYMRKKALGIR